MSRRKSSPSTAPYAEPARSTSHRPTRQPSPSTSPENDAATRNSPPPATSHAHDSSTGAITAVTVGSQKPETGQMPPLPVHTGQETPVSNPVPSMSQTPEQEAVQTLRDNLGITRLEAQIQELLARSSIMPLPQQAQPRDMKTAIVDLIGQLANAASKFQAPPDSGLQQQLVAMTMNHFATLDSVLLKMAAVPAPPQHMRIVE